MSLDPRAQHVNIYPANGRIPFCAWAESGWTLESRCWSCGHVRYFGPDELVQRFGSAGCTDDLFRRLKCKCGIGKPAMRAVIR